MEITIVGQGFKLNSQKAVGHYLIEFLVSEDFHTFTALSAFASEAGIHGLSSHITEAKKRFEHLSVVVGVDQEGTSREALDAILALDIESYIFYQPSATIFHPKIYLFEGDQTARLMVGSSNMAVQGLFSNVETSVLISIDLTIDTDRQVVQEVKDYFDSIFDRNDSNLKRLTQELVRELVELGIVPTEAERKTEQIENATLSENPLNSKRILALFPQRKISSVPSEFRRKRSATQATAEVTQKFASKSSTKGRLVWTRRNLPASSVQAAGSGTNPTGGLRLVQDRFEVDGQKINQTTYFRDRLFANYSWSQIRDNPPVEVATVPFEVVIRGESIGRFDLEVRHKPSGEAGQRNYTTSVSWGPLSQTIREAKLTGAQLDLYAPKSSKDPFLIDII